MKNFQFLFKDFNIIKIIMKCISFLLLIIPIQSYLLNNFKKGMSSILLGSNLIMSPVQEIKPILSLLDAFFILQIINMKIINTIVINIVIVLKMKKQL